MVEQTNIKSKVVLVVLTCIGLSFFGIDRMYAGQVWLGILKLVTLGGLGIWYFVDFLIVIINALSKSKNGVFGIKKWSDSLNISFYVALVLVVLKVIIIAISVNYFYSNIKNNTNKSNNNNNAIADIITRYTSINK